jgi:hypothetical protein
MSKKKGEFCLAEAAEQGTLTELLFPGKAE